MAHDTITANPALQLAELVLAMDLPGGHGMQARRLARTIYHAQPQNPVGNTPTVDPKPSAERVDTTFVMPTESPERLAIREALGCFTAAQIEGLTTLLQETPDLRLKDLVERRLMYAVPALEQGLKKGTGR